MLKYDTGKCHAMISRCKQLGMSKQKGVGGEVKRIEKLR